MALDFSNLSTITSSSIPNARLYTGALVQNTIENITFQTLCLAYHTLFAQSYGAIFNNLAARLVEINNEGEPKPVKTLTAPTVIDGEGNIKDEDLDIEDLPICGLNSNDICDESKKAYLFYLREINNSLRLLYKYIQAAGKALTELSQLEGDKLYLAPNLLSELDRYNMLCEEIYKDFSRHLIFNLETDSWSEVYDAVTCEGDLFLNENMPTCKDIESLRRVNVAAIGSVEKKEITSMSELSLLDKLYYIRKFHTFYITQKKKGTSIFPNDLLNGYPCVENIPSTEATKQTKEMGALEPFYTGYLIDREGAINAIASFFELKADAVRTNLTLFAQVIESINQCMQFLNRGLDLLNQSQSPGEKKNRIPDASYLALNLFAEGRLRGFKKLEIDGVTTKYMVLSCGESYGKDTNNTYLTSNGRYLLVKANEDGIKTLLGDKVSGEGNNCNSNGLNYQLIDKFLKSSSGSFRNEIFSDDTFTIYSHFTNSLTFNGSDNTILFAKANVYWASENLINWLPKEIEVGPVLASSVMLYSSGDWRTGEKIETNVSTSWNDAFSKKIDFLNNATSSINTDMTTSRDKINTFESTASTLFAKANEVSMSISSNAR